MNKSNTYFVPILISTLPEYISSGFIGLTSSKEPETDIQVLGYPNVSVVDSIEEVPLDVCIEIKTSEIAIESKKKNYKYLILNGPISIARAQRIIFFDQELKENFLASFSMLPDIPIDFFEFTLEERKIIPKVSKVSPSRNRLYNITDSANLLTSLNIAIVEFYQQMNLQVNDLQLNYSRKGPKLAYLTICHELILRILKALNITEKTKEHEFDMLGLYFSTISAVTVVGGMLSAQYIVKGMTALTETPIPKPTPDGEVKPGKPLGLEILEQYTDHARTETNKINPVIPRILQMTQNILIGVEFPDSITDDKLVLQRSIFLASISDNYESLQNWEENLKPNKTIMAIATLLVLSRTRTNFLPEELWRKDRKQFDQYLLLAEQTARERSFSLKITKSVDNKEFSSLSKIFINDTEISSKKVKFDSEIMVAVERLKTLKYKPKPTPDGSISINVRKNDVTVPITLQLKQCPVTLKKRNFLITASMGDLSQYLNKKKTRIELLTLVHYYMVSFGIGDKGTEISRSQLADTMDRDELEHHIDLVSNAYIELVTRYGLS